MRKPWPQDAPAGKCWKCPDCRSWATIGGNAGFHRDQKKHGEPALVDIPKPKIAPVRIFVISYHNGCDYEESREILMLACSDHLKADAISTELGKWFKRQRERFPTVDSSLNADEWNEQSDKRTEKIKRIRVPHGLTDLRDEIQSSNDGTFSIATLLLL